MSTSTPAVVFDGSEEIVKLPTWMSLPSSVALAERYTRPEKGVICPVEPLLRMVTATCVNSLGVSTPMGKSTEATVKSTARSLRGSSDSSAENVMQTRSEQGWGGV